VAEFAATILEYFCGDAIEKIDVGGSTSARFLNIAAGAPLQQGYVALSQASRRNSQLLPGLEAINLNGNPPIHT
jgi:hypothetical protein